MKGKDQLFRKESLERISSPEQMHDYMRVTTPRMWMILSAITVLLIGFVVYASTATMESTIEITLLSEEGRLSSDVSFSQADIIKTHMPVRIDNYTGYVDQISQIEKLKMELSFDSDTTLEDGIYEIIFDDPNGELTDFRYGNAPFITVNNGIISMYDNAEYGTFLSVDRRFTLDGNKGTVTNVTAYDAVTITVALDDPNAVLPNGPHRAEIVTESTKPISFLLN